MSNIDYYGSQGVVIEDEGELETNQYGLSTCTAVFSTPGSQWSKLPDIGATHPTFKALSMSHRIVKMSGTFAKATCRYGGFTGTEGGGESSANVSYELFVGAGESPIDTHPKFVTEIGGSATNPMNGAVFRWAGESQAQMLATEDNPAPGLSGGDAESNAGWVFDHFNLVDSTGGQNQYAKVETYLDASQLTLRKTTVGHVASSVDVLYAGKIDDPTGSPFRIPSGRNWLNMGLTSTINGSARIFVQEWRASGPRKWNETIYNF